MASSFFDSAMYQPQNYGGIGGLLGNILKTALLNPTQSQGFDQSNPAMQPQVGPTMAQGNQGQMGGVPFPIFGQAPQVDQAQLPANSQPTQGVMPQQQNPLLGSSGGLFGGIQSKLSDIAGALNPQIGQVNMQKQKLNASYQALRNAGVPDATARAAALDPEVMKTIAGNYFDTAPKFGQIGENQLGVKQFGFISPSQKTVTPAQTAGGTQTSGGAQGGIDPSLTGDAFLQAVAADPSLGPGKAQMVKAIAEGRQPYPSGFLLKTPFGQWLTTAVGQYEPGLDATLIGQRSTFNKQMGSAAPSSVGGQKTLMGTSLGHLADVAEAAADMGNKDTPIAALGHTLNYVGNLSTANAAKANKLNETVDRFSGEVGKLYSGSAGGGVQEREQTRSRFGASMTSAELAAGLEASRDLIKSKLDALENQQDQIFGPNNKNRMDFLGQNGRAALAKIDAAITRLKSGHQPARGVNAPKVGDVQQGYRFKGGNPADQNSWERVQ